MKNCVLVYRLETKDGVGPYYHDVDGDEDGRSHVEIALDKCNRDYGALTHSKHHPTPNKDTRLTKDSRYNQMVNTWRWKCGFHGITQFKKWFNNFEDVLVELEKTGIRLVRYTIPKDKVIIGKAQVLVIISSNNKFQKIILSPSTLQEHPF